MHYSTIVLFIVLKVVLFYQRSLGITFNLLARKKTSFRITAWAKWAEEDNVMGRYHEAHPNNQSKPLNFNNT